MCSCLHFAYSKVSHAIAFSCLSLIITFSFLRLINCYQSLCFLLCGNCAFLQKFPHQKIRWNYGIFAVFYVVNTNKNIIFPEIIYCMWYETKYLHSHKYLYFLLTFPQSTYIEKTIPGRYISCKNSFYKIVSKITIFTQ